VSKLLLLLLFMGCSSLAKLERMERPIIIISKTNLDGERSVILKDAKGHLLKVTDASIVYTYGAGDTLR